MSSAIGHKLAFGINMVVKEKFLTSLTWHFGDSLLGALGIGSH
jgi:hypothetical protein